MKNMIEKILGFVLLIGVLVWGGLKLASGMLFYRLLAGLGLGYALSRAYLGFAGSVNRAYNTGSTKLMRTLMLLFVGTAAAVAAMLMFRDPAAEFGLWINPINLGLLIGGLMFGFGMSFTTCCASGVLTDLVTETPKAFVTLIFFGLGVFVGFPVQKSQSWVTTSWFSSGERFPNGVFMPDWFAGGPANGYLGALLVTILFAGIVWALSIWYEKKRLNAGRLGYVPAEKRQERQESIDPKKFKLFSKDTYYHVFSKPWSLRTGAVVIMLIFISMMAVTGSGWGASTPFGHWFGRVLRVFGVSTETLTNFTGHGEQAFAAPFFEIPINVQNIGIIIGTLVYFLTSGQLAETNGANWRIPGWQFLLFAMGGFFMGFGTRLSNGCNVGALYTPIANFSLSGWIWFVVMVLGGFLGNTVQKMIFSKAAKD